MLALILFQLNKFDFRYTEGDAWQYRFFLPHNTPRLVELFGSPKIFAEDLDTFFVFSRDWPTMTIPNPYYWAGNEHDLFSVWQFHYANRSDLTQLYIHVGYLIMFTQQNLMEYLAMMIIRRNNGPCTNGSSTVQ